MVNKINNIVLYILIFFSIYCALIIGISWDELAVIDRGHEKLKYLNEWNNSRFRAACRYIKGLSKCASVQVPQFDLSRPKNHVFHLFVIQCERRDDLQKFLMVKNILIKVIIYLIIFLEIQKNYIERLVK